MRVFKSGNMVLFEFPDSEGQNIQRREPKGAVSYLVDSSNNYTFYNKFNGQVLFESLYKKPLSEFQQENGSAWPDNTTFQAELDDILGSSNGGGAGSINYIGEFNNYTDLTTSQPAGTANRFAYVLNSQGTQWLPGSIGGSYYGAGWYFDTGSIWANKNDAIFEALEPTQKQGFIDYNDTTGPISLSANTWTNIPNNGLGAFTNKTYAPDNVTELMDTSNGSIDTSQLSLGDTILIRNDYQINPTTNNALLEFRYSLGTGAGSYVLESTIGRLDNGSGRNYRYSLKIDEIYMGDTNTKDNPIFLQVRLSTEGTLLNAGSVIQLIKGKL